MDGIDWLGDVKHGDMTNEPCSMMVSVMVYTGLRQLKAPKKNRRIFPDLFAKNIICLKPKHELLGMGNFRNEKTFWNKAATLQVDQVAIIISNFSCFGELVALVAELRIAPAQSACWRLLSWSIWSHRRCSRCGSPSSTKPSAEPAGGKGIPTKVWVRTGKHQTSPNPSTPRRYLFSGTKIDDLLQKIRHLFVHSP